MKKLHLGVFCSLLFLFSMSACTENKRAKSYGGHTTLELPIGRHLVNITWKEFNMWVLTEDSSYYYFTEHSNFGVLQGEIKIKK